MKNEAKSGKKKNNDPLIANNFEFTASERELLKILGVAEEDAIKAKMEKARKDYLERHEHSIWQGADGRWRTHIPDEKAKGKRKLIARKNKESVENEVVKYLKELDGEIDENITLRMVYPKYLVYKATKNDAATVRRINTDWNKHYAEADYVGPDIIENIISTTVNDTTINEIARVLGTKVIDGKIDINVLLDNPISDLTKMQCEYWARLKIKKYNLSDKQYDNMAIIIKECIDYVVDQTALEENVYRKIKIDRKRGLRHVKKKDRKHEVFTKKEANAIVEAAIKHFYSKNRLDYKLAPLAIVFQLLVGCRIGEVLALTFEDIKEKQVGINKMFKKEEKEIVDRTKMNHDRDADLIQEAREIVEIARKYQSENGGAGVLIFSMDKKPIGYRTINSLLKKYCEEIGIPVRTSHKLRKTNASLQGASGLVNLSTIANNLGHEDEMYTMKNYIYDVDEIDEREAKISEALDIKPVWRDYDKGS